MNSLHCAWHSAGKRGGIRNAMTVSLLAGLTCSCVSQTRDSLEPVEEEVRVASGWVRDDSQVLDTNDNNTLTGSGIAKGPVNEPIDGFNFVVGTQTIGASYHFTNEPRVIETAKAILAMGSNAIKIRVGENSDQVLAMPFKYYFLWFNSCWAQTDGFRALSQVELDAEYRTTYEYARKLLLQYSGSGKAFFLGHWEGDWCLLPNYDGKVDASLPAVDAMVSWLNIRQKAVDDAKRDTRHTNVDVYHFTEVNRVRDAMVNGKRRLVNAVLPRVNVDFVSSSAYDMQQLDEKTVHDTLDYVATRIAPKPGISGKRLFIGEFGIPQQKWANYTGAQHEKINTDIIVKFLTWGSPFILYWEMYNNEVKDGKQLGYWLINDKNEKQPLYFTFQNLYKQGRNFVTQSLANAQRVPTNDEFTTWAAQWLQANSAGRSVHN